PRSTQTSTRGGASETEQKEFAVMPWRPDPRRVVTTASPLAQRLMTSLNSSGSTGKRLAAVLPADPYDLVPGGARRNLGLDPVPNLLADQRIADRRFVRDPVFQRIRFDRP